jgi:hypothetical protein
MHLKTKLNILKKPTFLLLGPSSFELWFESYSSIIVGSLYFLQFATGSSFVYLSPPLLCFSAARCRRSAGHVPCTSPPQSRPEAGHVPPQHLPCRSLASRWLFLASPRRPLSARAAPRCRSPSQQPQRHLLFPGNPMRHSPALLPPSRPCAVSSLRSPRCTASARAPPWSPRAPPMCQLLLQLGHVLFLIPSTS